MHKLTKQELEVLSIIQKNSNPISANDILIELKGTNLKANRMSIHRCLSNLSKINLIHKIDFNNTYKLCSHSHKVFCNIFICQNCNLQIEINSIKLQESIEEEAKLINFHLSKDVQIVGLCNICYNNFI
jgi:Fe2+ or Zn2+ uptake regulation protein